jgi:hypothetical protein
MVPIALHATQPALLAMALAVTIVPHALLQAYRYSTIHSVSRLVHMELSQVEQHVSAALQTAQHAPTPHHAPHALATPYS